jgi:hypothetical protein
VLRSYINWSCISTWTQTSTVWTDIQIDGRHIDITQIHGITDTKIDIIFIRRWRIRQLVLLDLFVWCSSVQSIFQPYFMTYTRLYFSHFWRVFLNEILCHFFKQWFLNYSMAFDIWYFKMFSPTLFS